MPTPLKVLILEDRVEDARLMLHELRRAGFDPEWQRLDTEAEYLARLGPDWDVVLADGVLPQFTAEHALDLMQQRNLDIPLIVVTGTLSEETAVAHMKRGAADYLLKDRLTRLGPAVRQALERSRLDRERRRAEEECHRFFDL